MLKGSIRALRIIDDTRTGASLSPISKILYKQDAQKHLATLPYSHATDKPFYSSFLAQEEAMNVLSSQPGSQWDFTFNLEEIVSR